MSVAGIQPDRVNRGRGGLDATARADRYVRCGAGPHGRASDDVGNLDVPVIARRIERDGTRGRQGPGAQRSAGLRDAKGGEVPIDHAPRALERVAHRHIAVALQRAAAESQRPY